MVEDQESLNNSILILDQDKSFVTALSQRLKICGYVTIGITHGAQFFPVTTKFKPRFIILSDNLKNPKWDELIVRIRGSNTIKSAIFLLFCRELSVPIKKRAQLFQITQLIPKPFKFSDFLEKLKSEE